MLLISLTLAAWVLAGGYAAWYVGWAGVVLLSILHDRAADNRPTGTPIAMTLVLAWLFVFGPLWRGAVDVGWIEDGRAATLWLLGGFFVSLPLCGVVAHAIQSARRAIASRSIVGGGSGS